MGSASVIHQHKAPPKWGPPLEFIIQKGGPPIGTISMDLAVPNINTPQPKSC